VRRFTVSCLSLLLMGVFCEAPAQVRVTKAGSAKSLMNWSAFSTGTAPAARAFFETLRADLVRSGWFREASAGGGEFTLRGTCVQEGDRLQVKCQVLVTASGDYRLSRSYREPAAHVRPLAHRVADDIVEAVTGRKGIASTRVVMVGNRTGSKELYICDADGDGLKQLTRDQTVSVGPGWGPDGRSIIYTSYLKRFPDVYLIDIVSGQRKRISSYPGLNTGGAIAPNGRDAALILSKDGNPELYVKNLENGQLSRLTETRHAAEASPVWSPDGQRIAYVSDRSGRPQIYVIDRSGGAPTRLTRRGSENVAPDWGPNGLLAIASRVGGRYRIHVLDPATGQTKQLPLDGADYEDPSWAPDGRHLVCTRTENYRSQVYILDTMGDPPVALLRHTGDWFSPAWSPE